MYFRNLSEPRVTIAPAISFSSVLVISNALRLRRIKP